MNTPSDPPRDEPATTGMPNFQTGTRPAVGTAGPAGAGAGTPPPPFEPAPPETPAAADPAGTAASPAGTAANPAGTAANPAGTAANDDAGAAGSRAAELEAAVEEMREKWLRAEAEVQNVRNRAKREVEDARQYAVQKFAKDVVEAAENLRRGLSSLPSGEGQDGVVARLREGFESVERSFLGILERNGIKSTDPTGAAFDANLHQAMAEQPTADHPPGTVIQSWTSSWTLNGRLLKPAMVVVAKAPPPAAAAEAGASAGLDRTA